MLEIYLAITLLLASAPPGTADDLYYDVRATRDAATLRFDMIAGDRVSTWGIIRVVPQPHSGSATIPGAYVEVETGKVVMPEGEVAPAVLKEGSWEIIALLQEGKSPSPQGGQYSWSEPFTRKRKLDPEDVYSPFAKGGVLLSRLDPEAKDGKQFAPAYLLPRSWEAAVHPAYEHFKKHPELSGGELTRSRRSRLLASLGGDNPVLSVVAFRRLVGGAGRDDALVRKTLEESEGPRRAVFTYLLLMSPGGAEKAPVLKQLAAGARGGDDLRPIALGAFAASLFDADPKPPPAVFDQLLAALRERSVEVGAGADEYLRLLFEAMKVGGRDELGNGP